MNNLLILQARLGSKRFRGKILKKINGKESIIFQIERLKKSKLIDKLIVAIPDNRENDGLFNFLKNKKINVFRGPENNVLERFYKLADQENCKNIIRSTADCPLIDPMIIDEVISKFLKSKVDYASNVAPHTFPDGMDIEIFKKTVLEKAYKNAISNYDKEHVTPYIIRDKEIKKINIFNTKNEFNIRLTLDTQQDYKNINFIVKLLTKNKKKYFNLKDILEIIYQNKNKFKKLSLFKNNFIENTAWNNSCKIIQGGNMLLSKSPNIFSPNLWPTYYSKAKGCFIWSDNNKKYLDMTTMGVGTNIFGYANKLIDKKVIQSIKESNMSSLNCKEEFEAAQILTNIHKGLNMVKFAKSGGEANAIAIRAARAYTKSSKVAICGYHGWHDWYLSANLKKKSNLNQLLIKDLKIAGVPKELAETAFPFIYNDFYSFKKLIEKEKIKIVKMEVLRSVYPRDNFLKKISNYCKKKNILLIFDECTTGFRFNFGGVCKKFNVIPDIIIFGKAIANGYPITAIVGKSKIMESLNSSFVSSTFWSDRIGYAALIANLKYMKKIKPWKKILGYGNKMQIIWKKLSKKYNLKINITEIPQLLNFNFVSKNLDFYKAYLVQEFLKKNILASNIFYPSYAHKDKYFKIYQKKLDSIFKNISEYEKFNFEKIKIQSSFPQPKFGRLN